MSKKNEIDNSEQIILGSGDLYLMEFPADGAIPEFETIETDENRAGNVKGGATLSYSSSSTTVQDDKGRVKKTITTEETVTFTTGLITWAANYIKALIASARVEEKTGTDQKQHRVFKIGGLAKANNTKWLWHFVHTRDDGRKLRVTCTGKNTGEISLAFDPENETTVDAEITADTLDADGTLVVVDDEMLPAEE